MRRWRKWWCEVSEGMLTCKLYESLKVMDARDRKAILLTRTSSARVQLEGLDSNIQVAVLPVRRGRGGCDPLKNLLTGVDFPFKGTCSLASSFLAGRTISRSANHFPPARRCHSERGVRSAALEARCTTTAHHIKLQSSPVPAFGFSCTHDRIRRGSCWFLTFSR